MKAISLFVIAFLLMYGCKKEDQTIKEVPDNLIQGISFPTLLDTINRVLPEGHDIKDSLTVLFSPTSQKKIILTKESAVYVMFVSESAVLRNTLGWYYYDQNTPPQDPSEFKWYLAFPNISGVDEGGELKAGDMIQLGNGTFPAGTVIGFYLIVNGWNDGEINYENNIFFTDYNLSKNKTQQHILFKERNTKQIVLSFEDIGTFLAGTDQDFNDIIVMVTDNKQGKESTSFDMNGIPVE